MKAIRRDFSYYKKSLHNCLSPQCHFNQLLITTLHRRCRRLSSADKYKSCAHHICAVV